MQNEHSTHKHTVIRVYGCVDVPENNDNCTKSLTREQGIAPSFEGSRVQRATDAHGVMVMEYRTRTKWSRIRDGVGPNRTRFVPGRVGRGGFVRSNRPQTVC